LLGNVLFPIIFSIKARIPDKESNKIPLVYLYVYTDLEMLLKLLIWKSASRKKWKQKSFHIALL